MFLMKPSSMLESMQLVNNRLWKIKKENIRYFVPKYA